MAAAANEQRLDEAEAALCDSLVERGELSAARQLARSLTARHPDDRRGWHLLARSLRGGGGDLASVRRQNAALERALRCAPPDGATAADTERLHALAADVGRQLVGLLGDSVRRAAGDAATVRYVDHARGKGVFAARDFARGQVVLVESPLLACAKIDGLLRPSAAQATCAHCLKARLLPEQLPPHCRDAVLRRLYPTPDQLVDCDGCRLERYCSERCRADAWQRYHRLLCPRRGEPARLAAWLSLLKLSMQARRSNGLMIARMFATIVADSDSDDDDLGQWSVFAARPEPHDGDEALVEHIRTLLDGSGVVNVANYRALNGMIMLNAQSVHPVSDLHVALASAQPRERHALLALVTGDPRATIDDAFQSPLFASLTAEGQTMLAVGNCMNHSCAPNVAATSGHTDARVQYVAVRPVKAGEELLRSYVDFDDGDTLAYRRLKLKQLYDFHCTCQQCNTEEHRH